MAHDFENANKDAIVLPNTGLTAAADMTFIACVQQESAAAFGVVFTTADGITGNGVRFNVYGANPHCTKQGIADVVSSGIGLTVGQKYCLAWKVDIDTDIKFFRKQKGDTSAATSTIAQTGGANASTGSDAAFGRRRSADASNVHFDGLIGPAAFYTALLGDDRIENYMSLMLDGFWGLCIDSNCAGMWPLGPGSASTVKDMSGNGLDATSITTEGVANLHDGPGFPLWMSNSRESGGAPPAGGVEIFRRRIEGHA